MSGIRHKNLVGLRTGRLTVIAYAGKDARNNVQWTCRCECGSFSTVRTTGLKRIKSCGCWARELAAKTHTKNRKSSECGHPDRPHHARGLCRACYLKYNGGTRRWYRKNRERVKQKVREWVEKNPEKRRRNSLNSAMKLLRSSTHHRVANLMRGRIRAAVKRNGARKSTELEKLLGCSVADLMTHLELHFAPGMSWANYGRKGWHIDHKKPCIAFDLSDPRQQAECFHYTNLQPLWEKDNLSKGARW